MLKLASKSSVSVGATVLEMVLKKSGPPSLLMSWLLLNVCLMVVVWKPPEPSAFTVKFIPLATLMGVRVPERPPEGARSGDETDRPLPFITDIRWGRIGTRIH